MDVESAQSRNRPNILGIPVEVAFGIFALLAGVNLLYLDIFIVSSQEDRATPASVAVVENSDTQQSACPPSCVAEFQTLLPRSTDSAANTPTATPKPSRQTAGGGAKEYYIPFGSGSGTSPDWTDVAGLQAAIDTSYYPSIKTVTFEVSLRIPTGNQTAWARLYNVTDKHPVWFSDVSVEGGAAKLVTSPPVALDAGSKTYQVQLKNSLGYPTWVDQARIRIITN